MQLPELPDKKKIRFIETYGIKKYDAEILVSEKEVAEYFEKLVSDRDPKMVVTWLTGELFSYLNKKNLDNPQSAISVEKFGELLDLINDGTLSNRLAKELFVEFIESNMSASELVKKKGMVQISDENEIINMIETVLDQNHKMLEEYRSGKDKLFGFFVGQVMKISNGKANPQMVNTLLTKRLKK